jgi:hypothetical protein
VRPTLVFIRHGQIGSRVFQHGDELPPDIISQETIAKWLDQKWIYEDSERRSLYRIFAPFSGSKESEELTGEERKLCL